MKCVAIGGIPATGKTTLMKNIIDILKPKKKFKYGLLRGYVKENIAILGVYEPYDVFGGTDKLSMAVQKDYEIFVNKIMFYPLFEGDRLFTKNNLINICKKYDTKIIILENDEKTLESRHKERNDNQTNKFIKGRITKINNILNEEKLKPYITKHKLNNHKDSKQLAENILKYLSYPN